jgi:hypothetical protein
MLSTVYHQTSLYRSSSASDYKKFKKWDENTSTSLQENTSDTTKHSSPGLTQEPSLTDPADDIINLKIKL